MPTTLTLNLVRESAKARLYENRDGARLWIPKSVMPRTQCLDPEKPQRQVTIEDWWLVKNPWPDVGQKKLF